MSIRTGKLGSCRVTRRRWRALHWGAAFESVYDNFIEEKDGEEAGYRADIWCLYL